jgi:lipopolysaccharide/colanic/teichoic acid biosynthesis glycosyltransferase
MYLRFGKRILDLVLCILILPLALPIISILLVGASLDGKSPVYRQLRIGRNGKAFECFKIRSMVADSETVLADYLHSNPSAKHEWETRQKLDNDPRVTRLGRMMRATSLDELPQILNVLRGEMSLVGPRPFTPDQKTTYQAAGGVAYFSLLPGITGPWQVSSRNSSAFVDRVSFDEAYQRSAGFMTDIMILLATVAVVVRATGQ